MVRWQHILVFLLMNVKYNALHVFVNSVQYMNTNTVVSEEISKRVSYIMRWSFIICRYIEIRTLIYFTDTKTILLGIDHL